MLFDNIEKDLADILRRIQPIELILTPDETSKAKSILSKRTSISDLHENIDLITGLDFLTKYEVILRHKHQLPTSLIDYFLTVREGFTRVVPVRNAVMHGRPLTTDEYSIGFSFAKALLSHSEIWKHLNQAYIEYTRDPSSITNTAIYLLDEDLDFGVLHNLPNPDYEDTGFLQRKDLEKSLRSRILGRYPVITVLGDGGNGKTALTLQTLWNLVESNDHDFDLIHWFSAKTATLTPTGIKDISGSIVDSNLILEQISSFEPGESTPIERLRKLLSENKVLLVIDNLETVTGGSLNDLIADVPGESKILITSRVPVGGDLSIPVYEFIDAEAEKFLRILADVYSLSEIKPAGKDGLIRYYKRLGNKPLLLKWFALGVKSGLDPERILANPEIALAFCLENVIDKLSKEARDVLGIFNSIIDPISAGVVSEISDFGPTLVETAIAELTRFDLLEIKDRATSERNFRLRPFVRSYVSRLVGTDGNIREKYQKKYQSIQISFEKSRASQSFNRYDPKNYVVRSKGEAVCAIHLKKIAALLHKGDFQAVEEKIRELKLVNPSYFELYRFEGYAAYFLGGFAACD